MSLTAVVVMRFRIHLQEPDAHHQHESGKGSNGILAEIRDCHRVAAREGAGKALNLRMGTWSRRAVPMPAYPVRSSPLISVFVRLWRPRSDLRW